MYCVYCGKELQEGEVCGCQQSVIASQKLSIKDFLLAFLKNPIDVMRITYGNGKESECFAVGGIYAGLLLVSMLIALRGLGFGTAFKYAFGITLLSAVVKVAYAGYLYMFAKKNDVNFKNILAEVCLATLPQAVCIVLVLLCSVLSFTLGTVAMLIIYFVLATVMGFITADIVLDIHRNLAYWLFVLFCTILVLVGCIVVKSVIKDIIQDLVSQYVGNVFSDIF